MHDDGRGAKFKSTEGLRLAEQDWKEQESEVDQNLFKRKGKEGEAGKGRKEKSR